MDKDLNEILEEAIAIIGMAGRFPGANNLKQFWENLCLGQESITFFSDKELLEAGITKEEINEASYVKAKGLIQDVDKFDAKFFGILPKEAIVMDPQHRILLECTWTALEDAGYYSEENAGRVAVFTGCGFNTYYPKIICQNVEFAHETGDFNAAIGNGTDYLSSLISYKFNLTGPSITVQTACSTSLVAITLAYNSLLEYQCDMAIAGGVSAFFPIKSGYHYQKELIFSADGHCRPLDANGTGTLFGMGVGIVILKRLVDAIKDKDHIYAVIRGAAVNNDGSNKVGYTAPTQSGQTNVIIEAQTLAQIDPGTLQFIEAHATGTQIGDPIEIAALTDAFKGKTDKKQFCALGTLKANIGHLDAAAGVAGFIKTVLVLKNQKIPPAVNFQIPNPKINFQDSPFYVPITLQEWKSHEKSRRAAVSSFGVGGTNAHVVLEEAPPISLNQNTSLKPYYLITLSARSENALKQKLLDLERWLMEVNQEPSLENISYTLNVGRKHFEKRFACVASTTQQLLAKLNEINEGREEFKQDNKSDMESVSHLIEDLEESQIIDPDRYQEKLIALSQYYLNGEDAIDWQRLHRHESKQRISLPTYPFERIRYWVPETHAILKAEVSSTLKKDHKKAMTFFYQSILEPHNITDENKRINKDFIKNHMNSPTLFFGSNNLSNELITSLQTEFHSLIYVNWGSRYTKRASDHYSVNSSKFKHYQKLIQSLEEQNTLPRCVIYQVDFKDVLDMGALEKSFYAIFYLVKALLKTKPKQPIDLVYSYVSHPLSFAEPFTNALSGLLKTLKLEYPIVRVHLLKVDAELFKNPVKLKKVITEVLAGQEIDVAYQHHQRYIKRMEPISPELFHTTEVFRQQGVYLITGGASGLGWIIANYLASKFKAKLILMGRSELNEAQISQIDKLIAEGAEIIYEKGDVANRADVEHVTSFCRSHFGAIHGVIHCAGAIHDALILKKKTKDIAAVIAAKIDGTLYLDELTQHDKLDCFVLFSSIVALFGNLGQSDYAYANSFMNAYAEKRQALSRISKRYGKTLSINWQPWESGGMQLSPALREWMKKVLGSSPLSTEQGISAFNQAMSIELPQIIILSGSQKKMEKALKLYFDPGSKTAKKTKVKSNKLKNTDIQQKLIKIICEASSLSSEEIENEKSLFELGMDSIILSQIISRTEKEFEISLSDSVEAILISPTIETISNFILNSFEKNKAGTSKPIPSDENPFKDQIVILRE